MSAQKKGILITGGAGYIGSVLTHKLAQLGYRVRIFDTLYFGIRSLEGLRAKIDIVRGDVRNPPQDLFRDITTVLHLAGLSNDPMAEFDTALNSLINTTATIRLAEYAKQKGVKKFIFASSCSIYDMGISTDKIKTERDYINPKAAYSRSKYLAEKNILKLTDKNFCVTILRKGTVFGVSPRMRYDLIINTMVKSALTTHRITVFGQGAQWRPLVSVDDVCSAYQLAFEAPINRVSGEIFNIAAGNFRVRDIAAIVQKVLAKHLGINIIIFYDRNPKKDRSYRVSMSKAERILSFRPRVELKDAIIAIGNDVIKRGKRGVRNPIYYNITWMKRLLKQSPRLFLVI